MKSRQLIIENHGITIIRTNPDAADFDINRLTNQIYTTLLNQLKSKSNYQLKKSLIGDLSKKLVRIKI